VLAILVRDSKARVVGCWALRLVVGGGLPLGLWLVATRPHLAQLGADAVHDVGGRANQLAAGLVDGLAPVGVPDLFLYAARGGWGGAPEEAEPLDERLLCIFRFGFAGAHRLTMVLVPSRRKAALGSAWALEPISPGSHRWPADTHRPPALLGLPPYFSTTP